MSGMIDYGNFFEILDCGLYIFFEDDFVVNSPRKEMIVYGLSRMQKDDRLLFLNELEVCSKELYAQFLEYCDIFDKCFPSITNWDHDIVKDDITTAFEFIKENEYCSSFYESLLNSYEKIDLKTYNANSALFRKYGLGVSIPRYFETMFNESIFSNGRWERFRIYTDFNSDTLTMMNKDLTAFFQNEGTRHRCITCIIDNALSGTNRAQAIISELEMFNLNERKNIIGAVFTSKEEVSRVSEGIFIEYVAKTSPDELKAALTKSAYSYMIFKLKEESMKMLETSFSKALKNRDIAFYLAKMAEAEGITNYKVITDWINLMYNFEMSKCDGISHLIKLTQLIDKLDENKGAFSEDLLNLNSFEAYDFNVNKYYQPSAAGDIFTDGNKYYILVGQDCDIMMGETRKRRNAVSEFVMAEKVPQTEMEKMNNNLKYMMIGNFKENEGAQLGCLKINFTSRHFLDNEIVNLCSYNEEGMCRLDFDRPLSKESKDIIMPYLVKYYEDLQRYYKSLNAIKNVASKELEIINSTSFSNRLISIHDYMLDDQLASFNMRRVCRLTRGYVLHLHKLFLEYRGRYPTDSINLSMHQTVDIPVRHDDVDLVTIPVHIVLSPNRKTNEKNLNRLTWAIEWKDIFLILDELGYDRESIQEKTSGEYYHLEAATGSIGLRNDQFLEIIKQQKPRLLVKIV